MDKEQIVKKADQRDRLIGSMDKELSTTVGKLQKQLADAVSGIFDSFQTDDNDNLLNNAHNASVIGALDSAIDLIDGDSKTSIINLMVNNFARLVNFNGSYFQDLSGGDVKGVSRKVMTGVKQWLGIGKGSDLKKNGYLDTLITSSAVKDAIKQAAVSAIASRQGWQKAKKEVGEVVTGSGTRAGAMERYYRNFTYDTYAQVDRRASNEFAGSLGYQFAIYAGGLIETSRKFCREHNGNVYHISEILMFDPKTAIPPNYDPLTDIGGYGCRHSYNWIPDSLAIRLRPDAAKFIKSDAQPTPPPVSAPQVAPPPAPSAPQVPTPTAPAPPPPVRVNPPVVVPPKPAPTAPTASRYVDTSKSFGAYTYRQARDAVNIMVPQADSVSLGAKVAKVNVPKVLSAINYLSKNYYVGTDQIEKISFSSTNRYHGVVSRYASGKIKAANFGSTYDSGAHRKNYPVAAENLRRGKSQVDEANLPIATVVHEWAHVMAGSRRPEVPSRITGKPINVFFSELTDIRNDYFKEINDLIGKGKRNEAGAIYLGRYAGTNIDEFFAEGFTEYTLSSNPTKYALRIGSLIDKYFKR